MTPEQRSKYLNDPVFQALVDNFNHGLKASLYTTAEVIEALGVAAEMQPFTAEDFKQACLEATTKLGISLEV